jgi:hypothetical protein
MSEKNVRVLTEAEKFSGRGNGMSFDKFDEKVVSWGRLKYGETYAKALWRNELVSLHDLNLTEDLDAYRFDEHCALVNDVISHESPKYADSLLTDKRFKTVQWQINCRLRFREKMFCFLESICKGEAARQLQKRGVNQMVTMRDFFFRRFGAGQPEVVKERERIYLLGMPGPSGEVFPPRINMEEKLDSLETERDYLLDMCPKDKHDTYEPGKETTLVQILLRTLPKEYDPAQKTVMDLVRIRKMSEMGSLDAITNLEDNVRKNYSVDWLPPYNELRIELINAYQLMERRRSEAGANNKRGHPVMPILQGHDQPGPEQRACYGCGKRGDHMRGDPKCPAGPNGIWSGAPEVFKERIRKRLKAGNKGKGKGKGKPVQRNFGNRAQIGDSNKTPCPNWSRGNGFCKYGPACRYSHDGPKGGKSQDFKKRKSEVVFLTTKKGKKARKQLSSLLIKEMKNELGAPDNSPQTENDDSTLYQLIRGVPSAIISRGGSDFDDFIPSRNDQMKLNQECNDTQFVVTLMMSSSSDDTEDYSPMKYTCPLEDLIDRLEEQQKEGGAKPQSENLIDRLEQQPRERDEIPRIENLIDRGVKPNSGGAPNNSIGLRSLESKDLIDRSSPESNLIDRASSSELKSKEKGLVKRSKKIRKSNQSKGCKFKPNQELDVFFDKFEDLEFEGHRNKSSANLELCSDSENGKEKQLEEWKYRAKVAEERVTRLQNLKKLRDSQHRSNIDKLESKVKELKGGTRNEVNSVSMVRSRGVDRLERPVAKECVEGDDDEWIVLRIPKNNKMRFSADFMDGGVGDGKEWLDGLLNLDCTIGELLKLRDEGRASRKAREQGAVEGASENQGRRRQRRSQRKPNPDPLTLRRSIAPGSYESWSEPKPKGKDDEVDRQTKEQNRSNEVRKTMSDSDVERYIQEQREAFRRPWTNEKNDELQRIMDRERESSSKEADKEPNPWRKEYWTDEQTGVRTEGAYWTNESSQGASISSPRIGREALFNAERSRQKRVRESPSRSDEEEDRLNELKWSDVVTSDVVEQQQAVIDFYTNKRMEEKRRLEEAKQRVMDHRHLNLIQPEYNVGEDVSFQDDDNHISGRGRITRVIRPGEPGNEYLVSETIPFSEGPLEVLYEIDTVANNVPGRRGWIKESVILARLYNRQSRTVLPVNFSRSLHDMRYVGIDTCSAVSVSTELADFFYLDRSVKARTSVSLNGVGSGGPCVLGRGPMMISTLDETGAQVYLLDPAGVFIKSDARQSKLRILGQQRMKRFGFNVVQDYSTGEDHLNYKDEIRIPLVTMNGILMVKSIPWNANREQLKSLNLLIEDNANGVNDRYCFEVANSWSEPFGDLDADKDYEQRCEELPAIIINEAQLTQPERNRLDHWRFAHRSSSGKRYEERCHTCEQSKHKSVFKRNDVFHSTSTSTGKPYWRLYGDAYGGQRSMGAQSYQGAVGGFVFVCPISGRIKTKLYATQEDFPAILYQVFQDIESEGYVVRELYVDTSSVNISLAAEEVSGMFKVRIVPISGGTPQELAYAESAVRTLGQMSRSLMMGAPHLPKMMWGLSDIHAAYIHMTIPQKGKGNVSPYEITTGRVPDKDLLFIRVFGCPCQYEPAHGVEHKRAAKTEWGWYVGVQWPMVLILRPFDLKILSISRKKVHCHEEMYAKYDPETMTKPMIDFKDFKLDKNEIDAAIEEANAPELPDLQDNEPFDHDDKSQEVPDHVLSVKVLSDTRRNKSMNTPTITDIPLELKAFNLPQQDSGENFDSPINSKSSWNLLLEEIKRFKNKTKETTLTESILNALKGLDVKMSSEKPFIRLNKASKDKSGDVDSKNIALGKRRRKSSKESKSKQSPAKAKVLVKEMIPALKANDRVKIRTCKFGVVYAKGKPEFTHGSIVSIDERKIADVKWDLVDGESIAMSPHVKHLQRVSPVLRILKQTLEEKKGDEWPLKTIEAMFPILEVGSQLTEHDSNANGNWPKDFIEALIRPDWRSWVDAVKSENESWEMFEATVEIPYDKVVKGASVIPLGELFTIKRSGKYKFRQIALGNLLKEGKDYGETFASTVSGDGLRWFCSLGASCGKEIRGWDATTGYLQTVQRVPVYAYLPSHHGYSNLEYEELAKFRVQLLEVLKTDGIKGIKDFSKRLRNERRIRPANVLELKRSVYGIPDAGQSFSMYMQSLHLKHCGMVQSDLDPCVYYKIMTKEKDHLGNGGEITDFLIVITWVDDCRYFGTDEMVKEYEASIQKHCKCTMEGKSTEFVSIQIHHDLEKKTIELTQCDYWEKAVVRFKEFLPVSGPKERLVPLSPTDERLLIEPTEEEIKAAEHLPFPNVLGVVQYPSNFTKMEMRYSMSVLSRHRTKWGLAHFKILLKALEYGWSSRKIGVKYCGNLIAKYLNVLVSFADSSFSIPRSQGCRIVCMNGAAISFTSKRHTTTDDSTTAAELTEAYLASCDVEGFRNLNEEIGLKDKEPTVLYQDNQAAIQIAMNRGSLSKKTRATEIRTLTIRNKIEDFKIVPIYIETTKMLADIGTKALEPKQFINLRDQVCGYSEMKL